MELHRDVYQKLYDDILIAFKTDVLKESDWIVAGVAFKKDSRKWWEVTKWNGTESIYLSRQIAGEASSDPYIYYRILKDYNKTVKVNGIAAVNDFQEIKDTILINGLKFLGYELDNDVNNNTEYILTAAIIVQVIMQQYLNDKHPACLVKFPGLRVYDFKSNVFLSHSDKGAHNQLGFKIDEKEKTDLLSDDFSRSLDTNNSEIIEFETPTTNYDGFKKNKNEIMFKSKVAEFENTNWSVYFYDELQHDNGKVEPLLNKGLMKFLPSGILENTLIHIPLGKHLKYIGKYYYLKDEDYLFLELKTETGQRNLRIELYTGPDHNIDLAIGIYRNTYHGMYAGSVIFVKEELPDDKIPIAIYSYWNEQDRTNVGNDDIWTFFADKKLNWLEIPIEKTNYRDFHNWVVKNRAKPDEPQQQVG